MKSIIGIFTCNLFLLSFVLQDTHPQGIYSISSGEMIFGFADVEKNGENVPVNLRFSIFFHYGQYWNYDLNNNLGFFTGLAVRNIGFITEEDYDDFNGRNLANIKTKRRSYSLGVPFAFKLGSFREHLFFYGGGEYELLFHFKEKIFIDNRKIKSTEWFSDHTNRFVPSLFAGVQFPGGINLRFRYYLDDFLNKSYTETSNGQTNRPYQNMDSRMFHISLSFNFKTREVKEKIHQAEYTSVHYANISY